MGSESRGSEQREHERLLAQGDVSMLQQLRVVGSPGGDGGHGVQCERGFCIPWLDLVCDVTSVIGTGEQVVHDKSSRSFAERITRCVWHMADVIRHDRKTHPHRIEETE